PEEFREHAAAGRVGHTGLAESIALIARGLGRHVEPGSVEEALAPVIAQMPLDSALGLIRPDCVAGIHQTAAWQGDDLRIELDLTMQVGVEHSRDTVSIDGPVQLHLKIPGAVPGDSATVATLLNHIN